MRHVCGGTTSPTLLKRGGDWTDHPAWLELVRRYEPDLRLLCRGLALKAEATDEVIQRVWIDLARRLPSFRYDPGRKFRGWLRRLCHSRAIDVLRERNRGGDVPIEDLREASDRWMIEAGDPDDSGDEGTSARRLLLLEIAGEVQRAVRSKVDPDSWRAYWLVAIEEQSLEEAARLLVKSKAATFAAQKRVKQRLRDEGERLLAERMGTGPEAGRADPSPDGTA
jgi:RNA polymerase sigma factor (sigma-70 family)